MPLENSSEGLMQKPDGFGASDWIDRRQLFGQVDGFVAKTAVIFDHKRNHVALYFARLCRAATVAAAPSLRADP